MASSVAVKFHAVCLLAVALSVSTTGQAWKSALSSPYGDDLRSCKENWLSISKAEDSAKIADCYQKLILAITPRIREARGLPTLNIPNLDPLSLDDPISVGGDAFRGEFANIIATGLSAGLTPQTTRVRYDPITKQVTLECRIPNEIDLKGDYKVLVNPGALFGNSDGGSTTEGTIRGAAGNVKAVVTAEMRQAKNGELRVRTSKASFDAETFKITFKGRDPKDPLTEFLNTILSSEDATQVVLDMIKPHANKVIARSLGSLLHGGWKQLENV